jgi:DNA-binding response OmpR family regulator
LDLAGLARRLHRALLVIFRYRAIMIDSSRRAVVVEDDHDLRELLVDLLEQSGFAVMPCASGRAGLQAVARDDPDLVTLDLNLPDLDGVEVCRQIRRISEAYIVMLTGRPDEVDRLVGLATGADDYLTKPFSPRELRARVAAMMRRPRYRVRPEAAAAEPDLADPDPADPDPAGAARVTRIGALEVDRDARLAILEDRELPLTRTEFDLLATLLSGPRRAWSREALMHTVWGEASGDCHLVEVHMGNLRRKLGDDARHGRYIRTVRGIGYRLGPG